MKKSISNRDVERIAQHASLTSAQVRAALALNGEADDDLVARVDRSARALHYTITARDRVAMAAGTSVATVNRAYRPEARHLVRPELQRAIEREAARLSYAPDPVAQARRTGGSPIVALCPELAHLFNPYHAAALLALSEAVARHGLYPVITPISVGLLLPDLAQSSMTSAVVLWEGPNTERQVAALEAVGRRAVLIGRHPALPSTAPDWVSAYADLTGRALERGYDALHLGYFTENSWGSGARLEGVARALLAHDGPAPKVRLWLDPATETGRATRVLRSRGQHAAAELLGELAATPGALDSRKVAYGDRVLDEMLLELDALREGGSRQVAVFGRSDVVARRLAQRLAKSHPGWQIGEDVGLAGHDNLEPLLGYLDPMVTTIDYDLGALAEAVIGMTLRGSDAPADAFMPIPAWVVHRNSL